MPVSEKTMSDNVLKVLTKKTKDLLVTESVDLSASHDTNIAAEGHRRNRRQRVKV